MYSKSQTTNEALEFVMVCIFVFVLIVVGYLLITNSIENSNKKADASYLGCVNKYAPYHPTGDKLWNSQTEWYETVMYDSDGQYVGILRWTLAGCDFLPKGNN